MQGMTIRLLSSDLAAQIAAGEVIERPASVVKELVENALDAGARQISIDVRGGGLEFIQVTDDGYGVAPEELPLMVERHATSKLVDAGDLFQIRTLGFRGEALASIAAAADLEIVSRQHDSMVAGVIKVADGELAHQGSRGAPPGTSVTVRHLFRRQPARLKFLRSKATEHTHLTELVGAYALAYPEVRFGLRLDNRTALQTTGQGSLREAALEVHGVEIAQAMLPVQPAEAPPGDVVVRGIAGPPHVSRSSRGGIHLFVNRRWIQSRSLTFAVEEAYAGLLTVGRHPIAAIDITLPYDAVDVNVHPTKAEVRFRDDRAVFAAVQRAVRRTLIAESPIPGLSQVAEAANGSHPIAPAAPGGLLERIAASPLPARPAVAARVEPPPQEQVQTEFSSKLPMLRPLGQVSNTYIITEGPDGMYLIDQHAAHERVLFERVKTQRERQAVEVQGLLETVAVDLTPAQAARLEEDGADLRRCGFDIEVFGDRTWLLRAVPAVMAGRDPAAGLRSFLDLLERPDGPREREDRIAATIACHAAVRAGKVMTQDEMRELVHLLEATEMPRTCPHGRPTIIHLSQSALEREFHRR
jgi:DNA mismatch repair protein MutL